MIDLKSLSLDIFNGYISLDNPLDVRKGRGQGSITKSNEPTSSEEVEDDLEEKPSKTIKDKGSTRSEEVEDHDSEEAASKNQEDSDAEADTERQSEWELSDQLDHTSALYKALASTGRLACEDAEEPELGCYLTATSSAQIISSGRRASCWAFVAAIGSKTGATPPSFLLVHKSDIDRMQKMSSEQQGK